MKAGDNVYQRRDLTGERIGRLVVIEKIETKPKQSLWRCKCDCGNEVILPYYKLSHGAIKSCGCWLKRIKPGERYGRLVVLELVGTNKFGGVVCKCQCDCGTIKNFDASHLISGKVVSCGCYIKEKARELHTTHGQTDTRLYKIWTWMKYRCNSPNSKSYSDYGARGIKVCDEWLKFEPFRDWALANGYREDLTIERKDNNGNYCPENCRWATKLEQANNKRTNVFITYNGETHTASEWGRILGVSAKLLRRRKSDGWTDEETIEGKRKPFS